MGQRPGGRSARVREAVHNAVVELLAEGDSDVSIGEIARRAGVNPASVYRRWGSRDRVIMDAAVTRLRAAWPMPDTGSLRGDLRAWVAAVDQALASPRDAVLLRALLATLPTTPEQGRERAGYLADRVADIQRVLDRAADRGECRLTVDEVLDRLIAPLYVRALFGATTAGHGHRLVDQLLADHGQPG
ncbi:TetR/AcrR family transcriptional regulator [Goodfellowiella coeruleoviolacea]|uniref:Transcriptional regulator, TetR family n=1 Tax=Goodfellowiella coeruleoviolacea TaxID=334858 RepID=A0AAE3KHA2_9PSEU|nr:TetR/AcrR family transcriptional regulator [Goodfellowiella coeruleoviolacea]MCP2166642.1 transcriptional regulator, TetR family [Goodfellowiella coeruleoviolacea]